MTFGESLKKSWDTVSQLDRLKLKIAGISACCSFGEVILKALLENKPIKNIEGNRIYIDAMEVIRKWLKKSLDLYFKENMESLTFRGRAEGTTSEKVAIMKNVLCDKIGTL